MKEENNILLGLGSNYHAEENIREAIRLLRETLPTLRFSRPTETEAVGTAPLNGPFINCIAVGYVAQTAHSLTALLKAIERRLGRKPEDKRLGRIPIDIDLIRWNGEILKAEDWGREYIQQAIDSLKPSAGNQAG